METANEKIEKMDVALVEDFFRSLVTNSSMNLHINKNVGINPHHIIEAVFKAFGIALHNSTRLAGTSAIPSTKGLI